MTDPYVGIQNNGESVIPTSIKERPLNEKLSTTQFVFMNKSNIRTYSNLKDWNSTTVSGLSAINSKSNNTLMQSVPTNDTEERISNPDPFTQQDLSLEMSCDIETNPEWQLVRCKKRKLSEKEIRLTPTIAAPVPVHNQFDTLTNINDNSTPTESSSASVPLKPPPIFIPDVVKVPELLSCIKQKVPESDFSYKMYKDEVKLLPNSIEAYRSLIKLLNDKKALYHTYQIKQERAFRVVLRNMHHSVDVPSIISELQEQGHRVRNIYNIRHRVSKEPLPLFYVDLEPQANNKDIYKIDSLMHAKITFEAPYKKKDLVQCMRCQMYGHTRKYCKRSPRCVKCGDYHLSETCRKDRSTPATCALCSGSHPANYKGCAIYRDIISRRYPTTSRPVTSPSSSQPKPNAADFPPLHSSPHPPFSSSYNYAQAVKHNEIDIATIIQQSFLKFENLLKQQAEQIGSLLNLLSVIVSKIK